MESPPCLHGVKLACLYAESCFGEVLKFLGYQLLRSCSVLAPLPLSIILHLIDAVERRRVDNLMPIVIPLLISSILIVDFSWLRHSLLRCATVPNHNDTLPLDPTEPRIIWPSHTDWLLTLTGLSLLHAARCFPQLI